MLNPSPLQQHKKYRLFLFQLPLKLNMRLSLKKLSIFNLLSLTRFKCQVPTTEAFLGKKIILKPSWAIKVAFSNYGWTVLALHRSLNYLWLRKQSVYNFIGMTETQSLHVKKLIVLRLDGAFPGTLPFPIILRYTVWPSKRVSWWWCHFHHK